MDILVPTPSVLLAHGAWEQRWGLDCSFNFPYALFPSIGRHKGNCPPCQSIVPETVQGLGTGNKQHLLRSSVASDAIGTD